MGRYRSGQTGQTVNLLAMPSVVRIHSCPPWCGFFALYLLGFDELILVNANRTYNCFFSMALACLDAAVIRVPKDTTAFRKQLTPQHQETESKLHQASTMKALP